jgi:hypothetical protein
MGLHDSDTDRRDGSCTMEPILQRISPAQGKPYRLVKKSLRRRLDSRNQRGSTVFRPPEHVRTAHPWPAAQPSIIEPNARRWAEVGELCRCEYWKRVWVLQELTLARVSTIFCGSKQVPEVAFMIAFSTKDVVWPDLMTNEEGLEPSQTLRLQ